MTKFVTFTAASGQVAEKKKKGVPVFPCLTFAADASGELRHTHTIIEPTQPKKASFFRV